MPVLDEIKQLDQFELAKLLPASYNIENSNISLILEIIKEQINELLKAISDTEKIKDYDFVFGKSIDYLGKDFSEERNGETDENFLKRIKIKKIASKSLGDIDTIIDGIAGHFKSPQTFFSVKRIGIKTIEIIYPTDFSEEDLKEILSSLKAAGIIYILTKDKFWEDYTYEQLAQKTYADLSLLRYERQSLRKKKKGGNSDGI